MVSLFAAGLAEEGRQFADSALRQALPPEEEARVRASVASMFDLSPEVRAENARAGLALPLLPADLRAELWAALYHSLSVAGRQQEAIEVEPSARNAAYASSSEVCRFSFELPQSGLAYQLLDFGRSLEILLAAERRQLDGRGDAQARLAHMLRSWILAASDRYEDALQAIDAGVIAAQRDRQNWALRVFETTRGRQMLQMGRFADAAIALEGRFSRAEAHLIAGALHAPSVVSLGLLKIHTADEAGALEVAEIAKIMLQARAPWSGTRRCGTWRCSPCPRATRCGRTGGSPSSGHEERLSMFPLYPHEVAYDAERVRIAAAVGDEELAGHAISMAERRASLNPDVASCAAAAAHARGIWGDSAEDLERAVSLYRGGPRPLAYASALEDLGRLLAQRGDNAAAIAALDEALTISARVGAALGRRAGAGPAAPAGRATASLQGRPAEDRLGRPDRNRVRDRQPGRPRVHQPGDRRQALHLPAHRRLASPPRLREARGQLACAPDKACRGPIDPVARGPGRALANGVGVGITGIR